MAFETLSPNMNLPVPGVAQTDGPQWASDLNASLGLIDSHDHSSGKGVPITPNGLNINAELPLNTNNVTSILSARFTSQSAPLAGASDLGCIYVSGVDLYYNDEDGNQIQITQGGGVAGSPGSISNLTSPASAAYVSANGTFVWQQDSNISADMDFGSAIFRNDTASSFGITVSPPTLASNYSLILPPLPVSQKFMTLDAAGNITAPWAVDNSTIQIASGTTVQVKDSGITTAKIADGAVTNAKLAALNFGVSASSGTFTSTTVLFVPVTNLSVTITTSGRPVMLMLIGDGTGVSQIGSSHGAGAPGPGCDIRFKQDGSVLTVLSLVGPESTIQNAAIIPPSAYNHFIPSIAAGSHTFTVELSATAGDTARVFRTLLVAYEIS